MATKRNASSARTTAAAETLNATAATPTVPVSGLSALSRVASKVTTAAKKTVDQGWELPLTPESAESARRWISAKTVLGPIQEREKNAKDEFNDYAFTVLAEKIFSTKTKPSNPKVVLCKEDGSEDHTFLWLMNDKFYPPEVPSGADATEHYTAMFLEAGLHPNDAASLVANELDLSPVFEIRSPKELTTGHYGAKREWIPATEQEKVAGEKLISLIMWDGSDDRPAPLTSEEQALVVIQKDSVKVKAGFFSRVATYCRSVDQLKTVLKIMNPTVYPAHQKFAKNDSVTEQTARQVQAAAEILGA